MALFGWPAAESRTVGRSETFATALGQSEAPADGIVWLGPSQHFYLVTGSLLCA